MTVEIHLQQSMAEESLAAANYRGRADYARAHGDEVSAKLWIHVAEEEDGHYDEFKDRLAALGLQGQGTSELKEGSIVRLKSGTEGYVKGQIVEYTDLIPYSALGGAILTGPSYKVYMLEGKHKGETVRVPANYVELITGESSTSFSNRPFPRTAAEWEDLGYDIEAKLPASIEGWTVEVQTVRDAVATATGKKEGYPEDAKRWLVQTAGKLGIG